MFGGFGGIETRRPGFGGGKVDLNYNMDLKANEDKKPFTNLSGVGKPVGIKPLGARMFPVTVKLLETMHSQGGIQPGGLMRANGTDVSTIRVVGFVEDVNCTTSDCSFQLRDATSDSSVECLVSWPSANADWMQKFLVDILDRASIKKRRLVSQVCVIGTVGVTPSQNLAIRVYHLKSVTSLDSLLIHPMQVATAVVKGNQPTTSVSGTSSVSTKTTVDIPTKETVQSVKAESMPMVDFDLTVPDELLLAQLIFYLGESSGDPKYALTSTVITAMENMSIPESLLTKKLENMSLWGVDSNAEEGVIPEKVYFLIE